MIDLRRRRRRRRSFGRLSVDPVSAVRAAGRSSSALQPCGFFTAMTGGEAIGAAGNAVNHGL